ncbi:hypothetical protein OGH69_10285 [Flavobacterium sp. MFBS3-15]|uniref:hypothetical protein n=1 Tax=Flavobacterium sp. MFBS3-15 TaxID=2989816 RepID=UPI0022363402|nr:hypothetical protein [Flavobacterium sp. MFBS3-15]MCW4469353.1 hypothetical protein [Flavobacterium sp. MFBS3-15]
MKNSVLLAFLMFSAASVAQGRQPLKGKVVSDFDDLEGIYVINRATEATVATTRGGYFTISAQPNDTLVFSALQFEARDIVVADEDFGENLLFVPLTVHTRELDEVVVNDYRHLNAESLGLVPKGQVRYTPAERKLATASKWKMNPLGLDPLINMFSGRTAMLQKAKETEKKEALIEKMRYLYSDDDIMALFKIPQEYVSGFLFFIVENNYFVKAVKEENEERIKFMMTGLAVKYLENIADEK